MTVHGGLDVQSLSISAKFLRKALISAQKTCDETSSILGSFDDRLSSLETAVRPIRENHLRSITWSRNAPNAYFDTCNDIISIQERMNITIEPEAQVFCSEHLTSFRILNENVDKALFIVENIASYFDAGRQLEARLEENGANRDLKSFLIGVDRLLASISFFERNRNFQCSQSAIIFHRNLLEKSMVSLDDQFRDILFLNSKPENPDELLSIIDSLDGSENKKDNGDCDIELPELLTSKIIDKVREIVAALLNGGASAKCTKTYVDSRGSTLDTNLKYVGMQKISREEAMKMEWSDLEPSIYHWTKYTKVAFLILFPAEKQLCKRVLSEKFLTWDQVFAELCKPRAATLFSFGETISRSNKSPEKLFPLLSMYETMQGLLPQIRTLFVEASCEGIVQSAELVLQRLAQTAKGTLLGFEELIESDSTNKAPIADGSVHPLTSYVINYIKLLFDYTTSLCQLFMEEKFSNPMVDSIDGMSKLTTVFSRLLTVLQSNLEAKAKNYRDPALSHIFLMNNVRYMVKSLFQRDVKDIFGDEWVYKHMRVIQGRATSYQQITFNKLFNFLSTSNSTSLENVNRRAAKDKFKQFNSMFEDIYQQQCMWIIVDPELRAEVKLQIADVLLPAYRTFFSRYSAMVEREHGFGLSRSSKHVKYSVVKLEQCLGELLEGKAQVL